MSSILDSPFIVFLVSLIAQWLAAYVGVFLGRRVGVARKDEREDFNTVQTAILTLLALIIGFSFSMAERATTNAKITKKRKPMRSEPNTCVPTCCPPKAQQACVNC
jgi:hypothetical protein